MMKTALSLSLGCALLGGVLGAGAARREGEVWSRQQEDAWHKEMGYQREVLRSPSPPLGFALLGLASLPLRPLHCLMQSDGRARAFGTG